MTSLLCVEQYTELRSGESLLGNGCSMRKNEAGPALLTQRDPVPNPQTGGLW